MSDDPFGFDWRIPQRTSVPPDDPVVPMAQAVVAPGRTVEARGTELEVAGYDDNGAPVYRPKRRPFGPGETVTIAASEVPALVAQGFLLPPASA